MSSMKLRNENIELDEAEESCDSGSMASSQVEPSPLEELARRQPLTSFGVKIQLPPEAFKL
jgi:hypothetical protein